MVRALKFPILEIVVWVTATFVETLQISQLSFTDVWPHEYLGDLPEPMSLKAYLPVLVIFAELIEAIIQSCSICNFTERSTNFLSGNSMARCCVEE